MLVGSSVAGTAKDSVEGTVIARSADTLTVEDSLVLQPLLPGMTFSWQITVIIGPGTTVTEDLPTASVPSIADISVGQHARFSGTLGTDTSGTFTLDATAGSAELQLTPLTGTVSAIAPGLVTVNWPSVLALSLIHI